MRHMAEPNAEANAGNSSRNWERNSTRQAILDAARRLAAREGAEAVTLARVAAEAGFAPPAVYAYFVSKDDLHLAVVADDLENLARVMRGEDPVTAAEGASSDDEEDAAEVIAFTPSSREAEEIEAQAAEDRPADDAPGAAAASEAAASEGDPSFEERDNEAQEGESAEEPAEALAAEISLTDIEQALGVVLAENDFADEALEEEVPNAFPEDAATPLPSETAGTDGAEGEPAPKGLRARFRRGGRTEADVQAAMPLDATEARQAPAPATDMAQMAATIAQLEQTVARLEARPVDSWLERRLRVFERTLADIEARMEKSERDSMTALSTVSEGFKALDARLDETLDESARRAADSEQRQRAAAADIRQYVKDLSGRLGAVEAGLTRALGGAADHLSRREPMPELGPEPAPQAELVPEPDLSSSAPMRERSASYLSAARNAARAAAANPDVQSRRGPLSYLPIEPEAARRIIRSRRTMQIAAGVLILIVVLIAANMMLRSRATEPAPRPQASTAKIVESPDARVAELAKAGDPRAELVAALKLLNGDGIATDVPSAAHWLRKSAEQNQPMAQYWLGTLYERGRGVPLNRATAMKWYELAARAGNAKAMYRLGVGEAEGWNGEPDYTAAAKWFSGAADLGIIDAQYNLAVLYERGDGVVQNKAAAFKWYAIAAAQGDAQSKSRIDALAAELPTEAVATAQAEAAAFTPKQPAPEANVEPTVSDVAGRG